MYENVALKEPALNNMMDFVRNWMIEFSVLLTAVTNWGLNILYFFSKLSSSGISPYLERRCSRCLALNGVTRFLFTLVILYKMSRSTGLYNVKKTLHDSKVISFNRPTKLKQAATPSIIKLT